MNRSRSAAASAAVASARGASPILFLLLTFGVSWAPWLTLVLTSGDPFAGPGSLALFVIGGYGPTAAALVAAGSAGRGGLRRWAIASAPDALPDFLAPAGLVYTVAAVVVAARYGPDRLASRPRRGWCTDMREES